MAFGFLVLCSRAIRPVRANGSPRGRQLAEDDHPSGLRSEDRPGDLRPALTGSGNGRPRLERVKNASKQRDSHSPVFASKRAHRRRRRRLKLHAESRPKARSNAADLECYDEAGPAAWVCGPPTVSRNRGTRPDPQKGGPPISWTHSVTEKLIEAQRPASAISCRPRSAPRIC